MKIHAISFTERGALLCVYLMKKLTALGLDAAGFSLCAKEGVTFFDGSLAEFTGEAFRQCEAVIFIGAAGIAVRAIAPFIVRKDKDPAVIVVDEFGEHVIPILSGHIGNANKLSETLAEILKGEAVITTATDLNNKFAVDVWAVENSLHIENIENIKHISAAILKGEKVGFVCEYDFIGKLPEFLTWEQARVGIHIAKGVGKQMFSKPLILRPKEYHIGIGCKKNTRTEDLEEFILDTLNRNNICQDLVYAVATIDIKEKEEAVTAFCKKHSYPLKTYTREELSEAEGDFTSSAFVKSIVGVDNVCERAAVLSCGGRLVLRKKKKNGMTVAIAAGEWRCRF